MLKNYRRLFVGIIACATVFFVAGCKSSGNNSADTNGTTVSENVSPSSENDSVPKEAPKRVVALNSTNVEIIRDLGKASTLVGVDGNDLSLYPYLKGQDVKSLGHPKRPNVEAIVALKPDLVISTRDLMSDTLAEQLRTAGLNVVILGLSYKGGMEGLYTRIHKVAQIFHEEKKGDELIADLKARTAALAKKIDASKDKPKVLFLYAHSASDTFIYGTDSGADTLIHMAGGVNPASFAEGRQPLTSEAMVKAAPDYIIMLDRGFKAVGGVDGALKLPGVDLTPAGKNRQIIKMDNSIRWVGPSFPEFAEELFEKTHPHDDGR